MENKRGMSVKYHVIQLEGPELRKYQNCVLDIAKDVIRVCDEEGVGYSLSGGSILGAIRHQGFIPWDDDIDINMPRADYDRLLRVFDEKLGEQYYIQTPATHPEMGILVTQIRKKGTVARRKYDWNLKECGISIDLYVMENVYDNAVLRFIQKNMSMALSFAVSAVRTYNNRNIPRELLEMEGRKLNYTKSKRLAGRILKLIPLRKWTAWCGFWFTVCKKDTTLLVSIPTGRKHFSGELYSRKEMCVYRKEPFETECFNVPIEAEKYLTGFYGDYMVMPPKEKQEKHLFLELQY